MNKRAILLTLSVVIVAINATDMEASGTYEVKSGDTLSKLRLFLRIMSFQ